MPVRSRQKDEGCRALPVRSRVGLLEAWSIALLSEIFDALKRLSKEISAFCLLPSAFPSAFCLSFCLLPSDFCLLPSAFRKVSIRLKQASAAANLTRPALWAPLRGAG